MALCWNKDKHSTYNVKPEINQSFFLLTFFVEDMFLSCHRCHHRFATFPEFSKVVHILALITAISCSTEQSFILLVQLNTTLRSNMGNQRVTTIALIKIARAYADSVVNNDMVCIIDIFGHHNGRDSYFS